MPSLGTRAMKKRGAAPAEMRRSAARSYSAKSKEPSAFRGIWALVQAKRLRGQLGVMRCPTRARWCP